MLIADSFEFGNYYGQLVHREHYLSNTGGIFRSKDMVDIWKANLDEFRGDMSEFLECLDNNEIIRTDRFRFEKHRLHFIASRGILRHILSFYLNVEPHALRFKYGPNGKPGLADDLGCASIEFSISHSDGVAVYAFSQAGKIGIDIEKIQVIPEMEKIISNIFSLREQKAFNQLCRGKKLQVFFRSWTLKEAFLKATGQGLQYPMNKIEVCIDPEKPVSLISVEGSVKGASLWSVEGFMIDHDLAGAVVFKEN